MRNISAQWKNGNDVLNCAITKPCHGICSVTFWCPLAHPWDGLEGVRDEDRETEERALGWWNWKEEQMKRRGEKRAGVGSSRSSAAAVGASTNGSAVRAQCLGRAAIPLAALTLQEQNWFLVHLSAEDNSVSLITLLRNSEIII